MDQPLHDPCSQPLARASSTPPTTSSSDARSVDQQLHEWGQALWLNLESADPFRKDGNPQHERATVSAGGGGGIPQRGDDTTSGRHHDRQQPRDQAPPEHARLAAPVSHACARESRSPPSSSCGWSSRSDCSTEA